MCVSTASVMFNLPDRATVKKAVYSLPRVGVGTSYGLPQDRWVYSHLPFIQFSNAVSQSVSAGIQMHIIKEQVGGLGCVALGCLQVDAGDHPRSFRLGFKHPKRCLVYPAYLIIVI